MVIGRCEIMDKAYNKKTNKFVSAFEIFNNGSYQQTDKYEWIAPRDSITNWDELQKQGIKEIPIHYVKEKKYINWNGTFVACSPCFAVYPNSFAKTVPESPQHKMLKNWMFNYLINTDMELLYSTINKKYSYKNKIKISELNIDWNNYDIEVTSKGHKKIIADILLPFHKKDINFGYGLVFEIQLGSQTIKRTFSRSIERALNGYSTVWLFNNDFEINDEFTEINLKEKEFKIYSYATEIAYSNKELIKNLIFKVEEECRLIDSKIYNLKAVKLEDEITNNIKTKLNNFLELKLKAISNININNKKEEIIRDIQNKIDGYTTLKLNELSKKYNLKIDSDKIIKEKVIDELNKFFKVQRNE